MEEGGALSRLERVAKEGSCAVLIQTKYRSRLAHKAAVKAAIKVQAAGRGSKVRRDLAAAKEKLRRELEELEKMGKPDPESSAPKGTKSRRGEEERCYRHQRPDPDVEPAELQRQLKLYVNQLEKNERVLKQQIEKIKRERPYLNVADQRGNTEKRREAQRKAGAELTLTLNLTLTLTLALTLTLTLSRKLEENAVELRAQRGAPVAAAAAAAAAAAPAAAAVAAAEDS